MTRILEIKENIDKLPDILAEYEDLLAGVEDNIAIKGKNIEVANREQVAWLHFYDQKRNELKTLSYYFDAQCKRVRGKLFRNYTEKSQRELSDRAKDKYIDKEEIYLNMFEVYLEVNELYEKYNSVVAAFQQRGYSLNNITKLRVASLEDSDIY